MGGVPYPSAIVAVARRSDQAPSSTIRSEVKLAPPLHSDQTRAPSVRTPVRRGHGARPTEKQRQLIGLSSEGTEQATDAAIARVRDASFAKCEREKIRERRAKADPAILVRFWLSWERQRSLLGEELSEAITREFIQRAVEICGQEWDLTMSVNAGTGFPGRSDVTWEGRFSVAEPQRGQSAAPVVGKGRVTGEIHQPQCTLPRPRGGSRVLKGDLVMKVEGDFELTGAATRKSTGDGTVLVLTLVATATVANSRLTDDRCMDFALFAAPLLVGIVSDPTQALGTPIRIEAKGGPTLDEKIEARLEFRAVGEEQIVKLPMQRMVTVALRP